MRTGVLGCTSDTSAIASCPVLSCPVLSCPVLSCPVLSCPVLSCPVLSGSISASPVIDDATAEGVSVDMSGQATFEAGVVLWEMAFRRHPVHTSYPLLTERDSCVLATEDREAAADMGYPVEAFTQLVRDMVALRPSERPTLADARMRFESMLSHARVSESHTLAVAVCVFVVS